MYDGVKEMIKREMELRPKAGDTTTTCGSHLKTPDQITGTPVWPAGTKSLVSKYVTPERFAKF
jgi:hypothetical protein